MKKVINVLSSATKVEGQGVGSAYVEQVNLIQERLSDKYEMIINSSKKSDIIHAHTVDLNHYMKMKSNKGVNVAYVHFLPDTLDGSLTMPKVMFDVFKKYLVNFYKYADYLVVVNPIFIKDLMKLGIDENKIRYIPNYVSKDMFYIDTTKVEDTRSKYNIEKDKFVVLGVGQVQVRKGVSDFIEVAKSLPDIQFVWCGGFSFGVITDGYKELKDIYDNPPSNVKFIGIIPREEMNDMYNMADIVFMPSYNELFPMTILEASNVEKPILLRGLELYKDILFNNYLSASTNKEFSNIILRLSTDKELYNKSCECSKKINEYYDKEHVAKLWDEFYTDITSK